MLETTLKYLQECFNGKNVNKENFMIYCQQMSPSITVCMQQAAYVQVESAKPILESWKKELGEEWKKTYVLIPCVWPVSGVNPR